MRLGEIKNILDAYLSPEHTIVLNTETRTGYGSQYALVKNYDRFVFIENFLAEQGIALNTRENLLGYLKNHNPDSVEVLIQNNELNQIKQYLNSLNPFVQMYYIVLEKRIKPQDSQIINIKLPNSDSFSIKDMEKLMKKLHMIFNGIVEAVDIPASFDIVGVDSGSKWLEIKIGVGPEVSTKLFTIVMGLLTIGIATFQLRTAYYESEAARLSYEVMEAEYKNKIPYEEHVVRMVDTKRAGDINNLLQEAEIDKPDAQNKMQTIVAHIVEALGQGVEFQPSLNPPPYIKDDNGNISIDYGLLHKIEAENNKPKQIEGQVTENGDE